MRMGRPFSLALLTVAAFTASASAQLAAPQFDPNDPDIQEMQNIGQTMMQRMNDAGIDLQSIGQQVQDGTFDPEAFQQMLVDKGVLDDALVARMQKAGVRLALTAIKQQLNAGDDEWVVLLPKLEKVVDAAMRLGTLGQAGGGGRGGLRSVFTNVPDSAVTKALNALKAELADKDSTPQRLAAKLKDYRDARDKVRHELTELQQNLSAVLTIRQEAILMSLGVMD